MPVLPPAALFSWRWKPDLQEVIRLKELFATLPDPRVAGRVLHSLPEVLLVALYAMICGCEDFTDMGHFALSQLAWPRQFIPLRNGVPSHDVFRNVFLALRPDDLLEIMEFWVGDLAGKQVTIDGKIAGEPRTPPRQKRVAHPAGVGQRSELERGPRSLRREKQRARSPAATPCQTPAPPSHRQTSPVKGSIRSQRKRCCLDSAYRTETTRHIFHGFGA